MARGAILDSSTLVAGSYEPPGQLPRGPAHYANFVRWWEDADPGLHEWREEARARLTRLLEATAGS